MKEETHIGVDIGLPNGDHTVFFVVKGDGTPLFSIQHPQRTPFLKRVWHRILYFLHLAPRFSKGAMTGAFTSRYPEFPDEAESIPEDTMKVFDSRIKCPYRNEDCPKCK